MEHLPTVVLHGEIRLAVLTIEPEELPSCMHQILKCMFFSESKGIMSMMINPQDITLIVDAAALDGFPENVAESAGMRRWSPIGLVDGPAGEAQVCRAPRSSLAVWCDGAVAMEGRGLLRRLRPGARGRGAREGIFCIAREQRRAKRVGEMASANLAECRD